MIESIYRGRHDPLEILIREEAEMCKGCKHVLRLWKIESCGKGRPSFPMRCRNPKQYAEGDPE